MPDWIITRIVREKFEVQDAATRKEALARAENPYSVEVLREGAVKQRKTQETREPRYFNG